MNIKDCEIGWRVIRIDNFEGHTTGPYTVSEFRRKNLVNFEEIAGAYDLSNFKLFSKFKEGDRVIYNNFRNSYEEVRYCSENSRGEPIVEFPSGYVERTEFEKLSHLKNKDKLEVGDKFKFDNDTFKILSVGYNDYCNEKEYYCKQITGEYKGATIIIIANNIGKIIYD